MSTRVLSACLIFLVLASFCNSAKAQSAQASATVKLSAFNLQLTYPSVVLPNDKVTVTVEATPIGSGAYLQSLTAIVYYADTSGLHQLANENLVSNSSDVYGYSKPYTSSFSKSFTVNVPPNAPRTSLVAIFSETVQTYFYGYGGYAFGWGVFYSIPSTYPSYSYSSIPAYPYRATNDQAIAPLSYINGNTPEIAGLQSQIRTLQQQLNQSQVQNQQLQATINQQTMTINQFDQKNQILMLIVGILVLALVIFSLYSYREKVIEKLRR